MRRGKTAGFITGFVLAMGILPAVSSEYQKQLEFSGRDWLVRETEEQPVHDHREIDIEFAPFEGEQRASLYASVQPAERNGNSVRVELPPEAERYYLAFEWSPETTTMTARPVNAEEPVLTHTFTGDRVPPSGRTHLHMNLWLFEGERAGFEDAVDVVVEWVSYAPLRD